MNKNKLRCQRSANNNEEWKTQRNREASDYEHQNAENCSVEVGNDGKIIIGEGQRLGKNEIHVHALQEVSRI